MEDLIAFLTTNPVQYLATCGCDGKAKCRPFMFAGELNGRLWFYTNNQKDVYKDLQENLFIQVSVSSPEYAWIRLEGKAVFEDSRVAKEMCMPNHRQRPIRRRLELYLRGILPRWCPCGHC